MKNFLLQLFTWWNGQTMGTRWFTARHGEFVGEDQMGNKYYRAPSKLPDSIPERRWVIYSGYAEASMIPPGWHGWMHHRTNTPPTEVKYTPREWQKPHQPNLTGSAAAYRPAGSILGPTPKQAAKPDYEAWQPE
jgi:NADH:ubiquinone oxidoreductase subunit